MANGELRCLETNESPLSVDFESRYRYFLRGTSCLQKQPEQTSNSFQSTHPPSSPWGEINSLEHKLNLNIDKYMLRTSRKRQEEEEEFAPFQSVKMSEKSSIFFRA